MRSDMIKKGTERAPQRSLLKAIGYTDTQIERPLIGIVNSFNEIVPGHIHLKEIARAVKDGVLSAGGTPAEFNVIGVCDGIAMGHEGMKYSLASREVIADSIECMCMAHCFDGLVFIPNCDKIVPAMLMAAVRMNIPAVFVSGGPMLSLEDGGGKCLDLNSAFEAVGAYKNDMIDEKELSYIEDNCCPGCGSCSGMFTANSMNCRQRNHTRCIFKTHKACQKSGRNDNGYLEKGCSPEGYTYGKSVQKRTYTRYGTRMLYKLGSAPHGNSKRG